MSSFGSRNRHPLASAREIQLLRETVATMMLRAGLGTRLGSQHATSHASFPDCSPELDKPGSAIQRGDQTGGCEPGERRPRILLVSDYDGLRHARELILSKQGYDVVSMTSGELLAKPGSCRCDLVILCQSLESDRARLIGAILRRTLPSCALLRVYPCRMGPEPVFDLGIDGFDGPAVLLDVLHAYVTTHARPA